MTTIPIVIPMRYNTHFQNGPAKFIQSYNEDEFFNANAAVKCGVNQSGGKWWLWFYVNGQSTQYYYQSFDTREEALNQLKEIFKNKD